MARKECMVGSGIDNCTMGMGQLGGNGRAHPVDLQTRLWLARGPNRSIMDENVLAWVGRTPEDLISEITLPWFEQLFLHAGRCTPKLFLSSRGGPLLLGGIVIRKQPALGGMLPSSLDHCRRIAILTSSYTCDGEASPCPTHSFISSSHREFPNLWPPLPKKIPTVQHLHSSLQHFDQGVIIRGVTSYNNTGKSSVSWMLSHRQSGARCLGRNGMKGGDGRVLFFST